jgi:hypothetical protein
VLQELPEPGQVAMRRRDVAVRFDGIQPQRFAGFGKPAMGGPSWDDDVVAEADRKRSEERLDDCGARLDVHAFIAERVAVVRRHVPRNAVADAHISVAEHQPPAGHRIQSLPLTVRDQLVQAQMSRHQRLVRDGGQAGQLPGAGVDDGGGNAPVVEQ